MRQVKPGRPVLQLRLGLAGVTGRRHMVSPGSVNTPIYYQAANYTGRAARPPVPVQQPERTAAVIADLTRWPRQHVSVRVGSGNPIVVGGFRAVPWAYDRLVGPLFKLAALTRTRLPATTGNVSSPIADAERVRGRWPEPTQHS